MRRWAVAGDDARARPPGRGGVDPRITNLVAVVITLVWMGSFLADIVVPDYDPSPFVHMTMMGLAGAIFGRSFLRDDDKPAPAPPPPPAVPPPPPAAPPSGGGP